MFSQICYQGNNSARGLSPGLWADCPDRLMFDPNAGFFDIEDFVNVPIATPSATSQANWGRHKTFSSTSTSPVPMIQSTSSPGGIIQLEVDGDNEAVSIAQGGQPFLLDIASGNFWWEARIAFSSIADTKHGFFVGLIDLQTLTATMPMADDGTLGDANFVGFHRLEGDGDQLDTVYKANGVTQVTVKADAQTLVADTFYKVGMKLQQIGGQVARLYFYVNGVVLADYKTIPTADGTDFPNDVTMGWVAAYKAAAATPLTNTKIDWIAAGYQFQADVA